MEDEKSEDNVEKKESEAEDKENETNGEEVENKEETDEEESAANSDKEINEEKTDEQSPRDNELTDEKISEPSDEADSKENEQQNKEETPVIPKSKEGKEGSWMPMIIIMGISFVIAFAWDKFPFIKNSVHAAFDPTAGVLLTWDLTMGMLLIVLAINLITTIIQKYATDQEALRELKKEQKILQEEMKKYQGHPEKLMELQKKQFQFVPKTFKLTSRAIMFTGIPFILFFRWFNDYFSAIPDFKFFGFLSWFWFYLIFAMIFSSILRKMFKVV